MVSVVSQKIKSDAKVNKIKGNQWERRIFFALVAEIIQYPERSYAYLETMVEGDFG
jgi:hypothetical protein